MITIADLRAIAEVRIEAADTTNAMPESRESPRSLTDVEQEVIADLLNQLQSSPFIRRSILRKLDLG